MDNEKYSFECDITAHLGTSAFLDASADELRVLLALISLGGECAPASLAKAAGTSLARAKSAVVLWESEGVLKKRGSDSGFVVRIADEFATRAKPGEIYDEDRGEIAKAIRDKGLSDLLTDLAALIGKPHLSDREVAKVTALTTQYALSDEYLFILAAHLASGGKLTVTRLVNEAIRQVERGIDTPELLEDYIRNIESEESYTREFRRLFGIYTRTLTPTEKKYFKRWYEDFGFSLEIVGEAYDISVSNTTKLSLSYMDKILTRWYDGGCKTLADCRALSEKDKLTLADRRKKIAGTAEKKPTQSAKFASFDPTEALKAALERSYGSDKNDD